MYWPTSTARILSPTLTLPPESPDPIIYSSLNARKTLFLTLTASSISIWRVRPSVVLAELRRSKAEVDLHGPATWADWSPDGTRIVLQTSDSHLILLSLLYGHAPPAYRMPDLPRSGMKHFAPAPGEGGPIQSVEIGIEGVVKLEGGLLCAAITNSRIFFSTLSPPSVQSIPFPSPPKEGEGEGEGKGENELEVAERHEVWLLEDMPWLEREVLEVDVKGHPGELVGVDHGDDVREEHAEEELEEHAEEELEEHAEELEEHAPEAGDEGAELHANGNGVQYSPHEGEETQAEAEEAPEDMHETDESTLTVVKMYYWRRQKVWGWIMSDGSAYYVRMGENAKSRHSQETESEAYTSFQGIRIPLPPFVNTPLTPANTVHEITTLAPNFKFSTLFVGTSTGKLFLLPLPPSANPSPNYFAHVRQLSRESLAVKGRIKCADWTGDGYAVAVGWEGGWGVWSVGGRELGGAGAVKGVDTKDRYISGVDHLFWSMGNTELFTFALPGPDSPADQIFVVPFIKSALTGQQAPENARYAFLHMDDRVLVYRGADQPDMSVINPESDVWQHIKIPPSYLSTNWPIRYASISADGRLIAVAGRRGLVHYSSASGRWKMFVDEGQEQAFIVRGGMIWFHHVLVAATEGENSFQVRLYSRDTDLSNYNVLHVEEFLSPILNLSLIDNSLLVYTADNNLFHFLIVPTRDTIQLHLCGSISFNGVINTPHAVRGMSWMIPPVQKQLGDPTDDLIVATVIMLIGGKLVLLRPRKAGSDEVRYDMQILADCVEFCWTQLRGVGALENSLWAFDGCGLRVWLDALTIEAVEVDDEKDAYESVKESVHVPLDSYPVSVLTDKGVIIGVEPEFTIRESLPFAMYKIVTTSHLFIQHVLRFHLEEGQLEDAVNFGAYFESLVYFSHALEILLHDVLEDEVSGRLRNGQVHHAEEDEDDTGPLLSRVVEFLDYFDDALEVVVGVARKTEMARWQTLFNTVGNPRTLFEKCLSSNRLQTAASYLLVLHNLEQLDESHDDVIRLLKAAVAAKADSLCAEVLRFLRSIDETGASLLQAAREAGLLDDSGTRTPAEAQTQVAVARSPPEMVPAKMDPVPEAAKRRTQSVGLGFLPGTFGEEVRESPEQVRESPEQASEGLPEVEQVQVQETSDNVTAARTQEP
ncbi:RIC1-domain-containing protein [Dacryopinax primogenitus]|uniref:RIC1-domain-containing protein n=1 Tax=Dacryopinax primogenitus (strain DJM 731) TaxID=1858805 RepID=M5G7J1_DACPD|nr:RIC1-domain-containing protein [Dacryopinax primogenitus]EJU04689.1 RIC1-domain-containing protein [Dacryopinax primogenitus]